jgi:exodeoxyribonuclease III
VLEPAPAPASLEQGLGIGYACPYPARQRATVSMLITLTTWNINSVRLRINLVARFIKSARPDVLCLQETKCIDDAFPLKRFKRLGYEHVALNGQKGYHGVAIISKLPFDSTQIRSFCDKADSRHLSVSFGAKAKLTKPLVLHNLYVPAGGDIPDPALNPKFEHKLAFLDEMTSCEALHPRGDDRHILVGDLNVAPYENDVWSHRQLLKVVSHTPIECEKLLAAQAQGAWVDVARERVPMAEKVYTWWSYRAADWTVGDRGRRLDHIWVSPALKEAVSDFRILRDARGWERPSDHVPVTMTLEV